MLASMALLALLALSGAKPYDRATWLMFLALVGALTALALFSSLHERQLQRIDPSSRHSSC